MAVETVSEKENVLIESGNCSVTLLPQLGGKIASIRVGDIELLQAPLVPYAPRTQTMGFDEADASGWDECLPSVAACTVKLPDGSLREIPDHGDLWRTEWTEGREEGIGNREELGAVPGGTAVTLRGECFSLPLGLERTISLSQTAEGFALRLDYTLTNAGTTALPWAWCAHPLFDAEPGDRIVLPCSIHTLRLEGSGGGRLGKGGDPVTWPIAALVGGGQTDLSLAQRPDSDIGDKLFAGPLQAAENWCALERARAGVRLTLTFDPVAAPYLGIWICYGGWPGRPGRKQVCVALEPSTGPVDSLAIEGPWSRQIAPGASVSWSMTLEIELLQDGKHDA